MRLAIKKKTEDAPPERGPAGKQGLRGSTGRDGKPGERGKTGAIGPVGPKGSTGRQGEIGQPGERGKTGAAGSNGSAGLKGSTGRQGEKGEKGDTGDTGPKGDRGPIGSRGLAGKDGVNGDDGLDAYEQWIEQGHRGSADDFIRALSGTPGKPGEQGERGPRGLKGLKGDKGEKGNTGARGADGWGGGVGPAGPIGADGADGQPGVDGQDGVVSPRVRGVAVLSTDVAANTTISTSTNATGTFLDYSGVTFADDVEIHINGVLMRCGATSGSNYDVYPAGTAANGDFACEFNIKQGDVIQQFIGGGTPGTANNKFAFNYGGAVKADGAVNTWYGHPPTTVWYHTTQTNTRGTGAAPTYAINDVGHTMPCDGYITDVKLWYRVSSTACEGDFVLSKLTCTDGSSSVTNTAIGSAMAVPSGGASTNAYDISATFSSNNAVAAGDAVNWGYRNTGTGGTTIYFRITFVLETNP